MIQMLVTEILNVMNRIGFPQKTKLRTTILVQKLITQHKFKLLSWKKYLKSCK